MDYQSVRILFERQLSRQDADDLLDDFIRLAEAKIGRYLRIERMDKDTILKADADGGHTLPEDYLAPREVSVGGDDYTQVNHSSYIEHKDSWNDEGVYCVRSGKILAYPDGDVNLLYCAEIPALIDNQTHWMLRKNPDLVLYSAMEAAAIHFRDDEAAAIHKALSDRIIADLNKDDGKDISHDPVSPFLSTDSGIMGAS